MVTLHPHGFPRALLRRLCDADDDLDDLDVLLRGRTSMSALQLRTVRDLAVGGLAPDGVAATLVGHLTALSALQRAHRAAVADVLAGPHFGAWAAHCTRRLVAPGPSSDPALLAAELGQLGCFAGAAAIRAGAEVAVRVPVRDGAVVVPATGRVQVPGRAERWATLRCSGDTMRVEVDGYAVTVPVEQLGQQASGWSPLAVAHGTLASGRRWSVNVDADDPYLRYFGTSHADPAEAVDVTRWRRRFGPACAVIDDLYTRKATAMTRSISCLVPVAARRGRTGVSATSASAWGAVALTEPSSALGLAVTLVHEHQHLKLNALHDLVPLVFEPGTGRYYSPWRDDPRPASGLLHGAYAFLGVADFWARVSRRTSPSGRGPQLELAWVTRQLDLACATLDGCPELTEVGDELVTHLARRVRQRPTSAEPPEITRVTDDLVLEHRVRWRMRNLAPRTTGPTADATSPGYGTEGGLAAAARRWTVGERPAVLIDRLVLDGRYVDAQAHLDGRVRAGATEDDWVALAVVAAHTDLERLCPPLRTHPELAYALYRELRRGQGTLDLAALAPALARAWPRYIAGTSISLSVRM